MSTRRAALGLAATVPLAGAPLVAAPAAADPTAEPLSLVATRTHITLPVSPPLGVTYIATFSLVDGDGRPAGSAWSSSAVVSVDTGGPVVLGMIILHLADGDIHYQRVIDRFGGYPRKSTGAVLGGTGSYSGAGGTVDVVWPDANTIDLTVHLS